MAGMRVCYFMARPDIIKKVMMYDDGLTVDLPIPSIACANASLTAKTLIDQRRAELIATRGMTEDFLKKRGLKLIGPSHANMLMIDWKTKSSKDMKAAFAAQGVEIARVFPTWPTVSRISIGSKADMEGFFAAFNKVVSA
jgi:histidinol-phosphate aminotransferase